MALLHPSNQVFAFSAPVVKGPKIEFALRVAAGLASMEAARSLALEFATSIANACGFDLVVRGATKRAPEPKAPPVVLHATERSSGSGKHVSPENRARYNAAIAEWQAGTEALPVVAARHGISPSTLQNYLGRERAKQRSAAAEVRQPQLKPSGEIL